MDEQIVIRCPNCGSLAQRLWSNCLPSGHKCPEKQVTQTECPVCDYFMVMCWQNGKVLEAYAPGIQGNSATTTMTNPATAIAPLPVPSLMTLGSSQLFKGQR